MNLLVLFIILNIVNVVLQTFKSLATVKCGKGVASLVNAIAYGLYTIVLVYTNCELNLWAKVAVVASSNLIGVYVVKWIEEKLRKDRLWKIEFTAYTKDLHAIDNCLDKMGVPHSYIEIGKHTIFNTYCQTQDDSNGVKQLIHHYNCKYFATETKLL